MPVVRRLPQMELLTLKSQGRPVTFLCNRSPGCPGRSGKTLLLLPLLLLLPPLVLLTLKSQKRPVTFLCNRSARCPGRSGETLLLLPLLPLQLLPPLVLQDA